MKKIILSFAVLGLIGVVNCAGKTEAPKEEVKTEETQKVEKTEEATDTADTTDTQEADQAETE